MLRPVRTLTGTLEPIEAGRARRRASCSLTGGQLLDYGVQLLDPVGALHESQGQRLRAEPGRSGAGGAAAPPNARSSPALMRDFAAKFRSTQALATRLEESHARIEQLNTTVEQLTNTVELQYARLRARRRELAGWRRRQRGRAYVCQVAYTRRGQLTWLAFRYPVQGLTKPRPGLPLGKWFQQAGFPDLLDLLFPLGST